VNFLNGSIHRPHPQIESETAALAGPFGGLEYVSSSRVGSDLSPADLAALESRWIDPEMARRAGLRRVDSLTGGEIVGCREQMSGGRESCATSGRFHRLINIFAKQLLNSRGLLQESSDALCDELCRRHGVRVYAGAVERGEVGGAVLEADEWFSGIAARSKASRSSRTAPCPFPAFASEIVTERPRPAPMGSGSGTGTWRPRAEPGLVPVPDAQTY
jgi:hypothetical protein